MGKPENNRQTVVWVERNGSPEPVSVDTGTSDLSHTSIVGGRLKTGDRVIIREIKAPVRREIFGIRLGL